MLRQYALVGAFTLAACAGETTTNQQGQVPRPVEGSEVAAELQMEQEFLRQAMSYNMFIIESSRLAMERGVPRVYQDYAELMIRDHTQIGQQLRAAADAKNLRVMTEMMPQQAEMLEELRRTQGDEFIRTYEMVQDQEHREAIQLCQQCAQTCSDGDIRQLAGTFIPMLENHLQALESTRAQAMLEEEEPGFEEGMETPDIR